MKLSSLLTLSREKYRMLHASGMFWEFYPDATGNYDKDMLLAQAELDSTKEHKDDNKE